MTDLRKVLKGLLVSIFIFLSVQSKAQFRDTVLVDYKGTSSCNICSDPDYSCFGADSVTFVDSTTASLRLVELKFLFLHTPCTNSPTTLFLNGDTMGGWSNSSTCQCNTCTRDSVVVTGTDLASYKQSDTNTFAYKGGNSLCIARYMIIRTWVTSTDYDMATAKLIGPVYKCAGSQDIEVQVANYGRKQVDSVEVHWTYNGVSQTTVKTTGTIDTLGGSGSFKKTVKIGSKTLVDGKRDTLVAWTEKPNGMTDTVRSNDTLTIVIAPAFKDTITVGGSSPDFSTIQGAYDALMEFGICGPVVINIRTATYNEQLQFGPVPGTDTTNTITIRSVTGDSTDVKIFFAATSAKNYTLRLIDASHLIFQQVTIEGTGTSYCRVVDFSEGNENIRFFNCRFIGKTTGSTSGNRSLLYAYPQSIPSNNIHISMCRFEKGAAGVDVSAKYNNNGQGVCRQTKMNF
jgi:hypothetical protein